MALPLSCTLERIDRWERKGDCWKREFLTRMAPLVTLPEKALLFAWELIKLPWELLTVPIDLSVRAFRAIFCYRSSCATQRVALLVATPCELLLTLHKIIACLCASFYELLLGAIYPRTSLDLQRSLGLFRPSGDQQAEMPLSQRDQQTRALISQLERSHREFKAQLERTMKRAKEQQATSQLTSLDA